MSKNLVDQKLVDDAISKIEKGELFFPEKKEGDWEVGNQIVYNTSLYEVISLYKGKIKKIQGIGHELIAFSSTHLGIDKKVFTPSNFIDLCSGIVKKSVNELTNPFECGGSAVRYEKLMDLWLEMCKTQDVDAFRKITQKLIRYSESIYPYIINAREELGEEKFLLLCNKNISRKI